MRTINIVLLYVLLQAMGCQSTTPFVDIGAGYTRFETDKIESATTVDSQAVETKITHADAFLIKARMGASFIEAVPQLRAGVELRGGVGGAYDSEKVNREKAYSDLTLLLIGGGPFVSWKQNLGKKFFIETGGFFGGYTVGVLETGRKQYDSYYEDEQMGILGWGGGFFGKVGLSKVTEAPASFALEFAYEAGKWDVEDIGNVNVQNFSVLFSTEFEF